MHHHVCTRSMRRCHRRCVSSLSGPRIVARCLPQNVDRTEAHDTFQLRRRPDTLERPYVKINWGGGERTGHTELSRLSAPRVVRIDLQHTHAASRLYGARARHNRIYADRAHPLIICNKAALHSDPLHVVVILERVVFSLHRRRIQRGMVVGKGAARAF